MHTLNLFRTSLTTVAALLLLAALPAWATELIYTPVNPSFGGNPANASGLLAVATAQNSTRAPTASPLQNFNNSLQQAILTKLTNQALTTLFGKSSTLVPGTYETQAYTITITDSGNGVLTISTTDKKNGSVVSFEVSSTELNLGP